MKSVIRFIVALCLTSIAVCAHAQLQEDKIRWNNNWFVSASAGGSMAFGDDSYNVFSDFTHANGSSYAVSFGKYITPVFGARVRASYNKLYSRVNLESYETFRLDYPDLFPRAGFYGYNAASLQGQLMVNVLNIFLKNKDRRFDLYFLAGAGANHISGYDKHVADWTEEADILPGGWYDVDTSSKTLVEGSIGGQIDFRLGNNVSLFLEAIGTFTGDNMEGITFEESYDVYITYSAGLTFRF